MQIWRLYRVIFEIISLTIRVAICIFIDAYEDAGCFELSRAALAKRDDYCNAVGLLDWCL